MITNIPNEQLIYSYWKTYVEERKPFPNSLPGINPVIFESWKRSCANGLNPNHIEDAVLSENDFLLTKVKNSSLIDAAHPYLERIYSFIKGTQVTMVLTDDNGVVLDMFIDDKDIVTRAKTTGLRIGAVRNEKTIGTGGMSTALMTKEPVTIFGCEHFLACHHQYYCAAAPIKHKGNILGILATVMPKEFSTDHTLPMMCAAVDGIEKELDLRESYDELAHSNSRTNSILDNLARGVIVLNPQGKVIQSNAAAREMLNISNVSFDLSSVQINPPLPKNNSKSINIRDKAYDIITDDGKRYSLIFTIIKSHETNNETYILINRSNTIINLVNKIAGFNARYTFDSIVGNSAAIANTKALAKVVAKSNASVLITGESGTGKEMFAQAIHNASDRANGPFIAINCASIPKALIESELFGYEDGAFTGAAQGGRPGKFELADGGTIFLDEIGDMPIDIQTSLLRVLQSHEIVKVGGKYPKPIDVRVIAATHQDLNEKVKNSTFRDDLYYRLNVINLTLPPLRERVADIPDLIQKFIEIYSEKNNQVTKVTDEAMALMLKYPWPGNIRELENAIERSVILATNQIVTETCLPDSIRYYEESSIKSLEKNINISKLDSERDKIINCLTKGHGDVDYVSKEMKIPKSTLYRKMSKYNINAKEFKKW